MRGHTLAAMLLVGVGVDRVHSLWGAFEQTVYDCEYDLDKDACMRCAGTRVGLDWLPIPPSCIYSVDGCCRVDGSEFEFFMKSSLANSVLRTHIHF